MRFLRKKPAMAVLPITVLGLLAAPLASTRNPSTARAAEMVPLGVYSGPAKPQLVRDFEATHKVDVKYALDYLASDNWSTIDDPSWWIDGWKESGYEVIWSVPMLVDGATLAQGAAGHYDHHFRSFAQALNNAGLGDATIRLGWEFNLSGSKWFAGNDPSQWSTYWRRIVNTMRSVSPHFRFDWCANAGPSNMNPELAYPGDAYVDVIGMDAYDGPWLGSTPEQRWSNNLNQPYGLKWHASFAAAHSKPMSYDEWALMNEDNPLYIHNMHDWFKTNDVAWVSYFDAVWGSNDSRLSPHPMSAAAFTQRVR